MASNRLGSAFWWLIVPTVTAQVCLGGLALYELSATRDESRAFSLFHADFEPITFTWLGVLVPGALFLVYAASVGGACLGVRFAYWRGLACCSVLSIAIIVAWWTALAIADQQRWDIGPGDIYRWFFVANGHLPPNEFGSSFGLYVVVVLLSLASCLSLAQFVWLVVRGRSTTLRNDRPQKSAG